MSNIPELRFKEFSGEWEEKKLGELGTFKGGGTPSKKQSAYWIGDIPWISSSDINEDCIHKINISRFINLTSIKESATKIIPKNSILFVSRVGVGKLAINKKALCTSQDFTNFIPFDVDSYYLGYFFQAKKNLLKSFNQGTSIKGFTKSDIEKLKLHLPSKQEQQKIALFLTTIDTKIEQLTKKVELQEQYKKGVMQKIFSREIRFKNDDGSEFDEWEWKNGNLIFQAISNKNHNSDLPILAISQEYGAIPRDMIDYKISVTNNSITSYKVVEVGDFIISLRSFQGGIEYSNYKGICSPAYIILRAIIDIDNRFFKFYFKTHRYIQQLNSKLEGIRDGKMISYKYFSEIKLPLPQKEEQIKIANFLSSLDKQIDSTKEQLAKTKEFKKGLLQRMFI